MKIIRILLLLFVGVVFAMLIGEVGLRIIGYSNPNFYQYDLDLGSSLRPDTEGLYQKEGKAYIKINSDGLRDVEHSLDKPTDVLRIAVLGDSYTEGLQVPMKQLFWKIIEKELPKCDFTEKKVEVINFGVSGYGTARELLLLKKKVWKYKPDIVLLAFLTGNDVRDNSKVLNQVGYIPYFTLQDGQLTLDESYRDDPGFNFRKSKVSQILYGLINHVRLLQLANDVRHKIQQMQANSQQAQNKTKDENEPGLDNHIYFPPVSEEWKSAWEITEALLKEMNKETKKHHARFMIVTLSNGIQVHPDQEIRVKFMKKIGVSDLFYPDERIRTFAEKNDIPVLLLAPEFLEVAKKEQKIFHGFKNTTMGGGHWNADGHKLAGELISRKLCTLLQ